MPTARPKILGAWLPRSQAPPSFPQYRGGLDTLTDLHGTPCHVWYGILPEPLGPVIFIHDVLATLSPYFLPSPFNRPMHKRSPFQYWSCYQVATSHWLGNFWTPLHLFNFVAHYTRFFLFVYHLFFNSLYVCTCLLYSVFLAEPAGINVWHSSLKKKGDYKIAVVPSGVYCMKMGEQVSLWFCPSNYVNHLLASAYTLRMFATSAALVLPRMHTAQTNWLF